MNRIKELREDRDLSQSKIAEIIKTTQQQYSKIETGKSDISGEKLKLLAEFYNISADYILGLTDEERPLKWPLADRKSKTLANSSKLC